MPKLKGVVITCNYPDDTADAVISVEMTVDELVRYIDMLVTSEPEMSSFVIVASVHRN
jgi:hypothetical protein